MASTAPLISIVDDDLSVRRALPITFITALDEATTRERFRRSGVAGLLRKPFDEHTLLHAIRRALDQGPIDGPDDVYYGQP